MYSALYAIAFSSEYVSIIIPVLAVISRPSIDSLLMLHAIGASMDNPIMLTIGAMNYRFVIAFLFRKLFYTDHLSHIL